MAFRASSLISFYKVLLWWLVMFQPLEMKGAKDFTSDWTREQKGKWRQRMAEELREEIRTFRCNKNYYRHKKKMMGQEEESLFSLMIISMILAGWCFMTSLWTQKFCQVNHVLSCSSCLPSSVPLCPNHYKRFRALLVSMFTHDEEQDVL